MLPTKPGREREPEAAYGGRGPMGSTSFPATTRPRPRRDQPEASSRRPPGRPLWSAPRITPPPRQARLDRTRPGQTRPPALSSLARAAPQASPGPQRGGKGEAAEQPPGTHRPTELRSLSLPPPPHLPAGASGDPSQVRRRDRAGICPERRYVNRRRPRRGEGRERGPPSPPAHCASDRRLPAPPGWILPLGGREWRRQGREEEAFVAAGPSPRPQGKLAVAMGKALLRSHRRREVEVSFLKCSFPAWDSPQDSSAVPASLQALQREVPVAERSRLSVWPA